MAKNLGKYIIFDENRLDFFIHTAGYPQSVTFALAQITIIRYQVPGKFLDMI